MLTHSEKAAGRWWKKQQQAELRDLNRAEPPDAVVPLAVRHYRHECSGYRDASVSFDCVEVYVRSPRIGVCYCSVIQEVPDELLGKFPHEDCAGGVLVSAGRMAFYYKEGRCARCGMTARSTDGRIVETSEREPSQGALIRG